jgi:DNA-binding response OmpR family regulator
MAKILIIDDNVDILDAMKFTLEGEGYEITISEKADYIENLLYATGDLPTLIILDVLLSGIDGRDICKKLKSNKETKHIPIIMISAHPDAEKSLKEVGSDAFLAKPFELIDLLAVIRKYIDYI